MLLLLLRTWLLWTIVRSQFNLYYTERTGNIDQLQFDCLYYYTRTDIYVRETIQYCLRPIDNNNSPIVNFLNIRDQNFTFDKLRRLNVTTQQLLSWMASMDLAERYQYYLDQYGKSSLLDEIFYNCTKPWFGSQCQYSFDITKATTFDNVVKRTIRARQTYNSPHTVTNLTCYIHLKCDRGGSPICLDWREVCDGRVDCLDGGADEAQCFELEMNECNEHEYRCHNGLCIPKEFLEDEIPECLDQSDIMDTLLCQYVILQWPIFSCAEHSCRPGKQQFSCGEGECVDDVGICRSGRHHLLAQSMSAQGNLPHNCWTAMACLTKITDRVDGISCEQYFTSSGVVSHLHSCESLVQFPIVPVLFGHVHFLYCVKDVQDLNIELALVPDYVCYDEQLCDFLTPTFRYRNSTCRHGHEMGIGSTVKFKNWTMIIRSIKPYFRGCLTRHKNESDSRNTTLYGCKNSSKRISKHRIVDGISDCYLNDDEQEFELSCSMNDTYRFKCFNETMCRSPLFSRAVCPLVIERKFDEIFFQHICDRTVHMSPMMIDGENHTDETECEHWPCSNLYTRCDGFWSCSDGKDEENCTRPICPLHFLPCVSPRNYTMMCLPANQVEDGIIDCLGTADELQFCRTTATSHMYFGFRCLNDTTCVSDNRLCNTYRDCPFGDDEIFCGDDRYICDELQHPNRTDVQDALCRIGHLKQLGFSLETSPIYPSSDNRKTDQIVEWSPVRQRIANDIEPETDDPAWSWRCNYGLYTRLWLGGNNYSYTCFCPPNYYGDKCQYQNQRVSLTLKVAGVDQSGFYAVVVTLIDDDDDRQAINSFHQNTYVPTESCGTTFHIYLLYSTQPKNISKNYSMHVDAFDKISLTYIASWHFKIPFQFLPVNRLAAIITIPNERSPNPIDCHLTCHNGECMKYLNEEKFFCQCQQGWSGARCDISLDCSDCSSDSICIGSNHNRSICVCPVNKFGSRCLVELSCLNNICDNNGRCIILDESLNDYSYACICPEPFYGVVCQSQKNKLEISFHNIEISSYVWIYIFNIYQDSAELQPSMRVTLRKLTMFQRTITVYSWLYFQMVFVKLDDNYYLAVIQQLIQPNVSTVITPAQRCAPMNELDSKISALPIIRRIKYYYAICETHRDLMCFFDEFYMCLCTLEHHANCLKFNHTPSVCRYNVQCLNGAKCFQDDPICPWNTLCACIDCFFGDRCQFYAKGIGLTLDDILRYEIRPNTALSDQPMSVKVSIALTMMMLVAGLINSMLSLLTFYRYEARKVGCGMYLLASSVTSFLTVSIFTVKFWFFVLTQTNLSVNRHILRGGCVFLEPVVKICLYMDNWLNACVAIERAVTVLKGINFDKKMSKRVARWTIFFLPFVVVASIIHEFLYRNLFDDNEEHRVWCVFRYSQSIHYYSTAIIFFHFVVPLSANLVSALLIIFTSARQRAVIRTRQNYKEHLREQFNKHKHLIISPMILVILLSPRLIISLLSGCVKASRNPWLYLFGYFVSFVPSVVIFAVFVLPSKLYRKQFTQSVKRLRR